jgi:hypothetical protein
MMSWSKFSMILSALVSVSALALHEVSAAMVFGGIFLVELCKWVNHPTADVKWLRILLQGAGILLQVAGLVLIIYAFASGRL